jgi:DNA-binding transcriptional LysR family regulator
MTVLDVESVQAFVMVSELKSFTKAAEALGTTQAAVSVKLKRLEDRLGFKLIERTPRRVRLSERGAAFLCAARDFIAAHDRAVAGLSATPRRLSLGFLDHVAGPDFPALLARLHAHDPSLVIEVKIDVSQRLLEAFDKGTLDAVIVRREDNRRDGEVVMYDHLGWFAAPGFVWTDGTPLRLASFAANCPERLLATRALDAAGIPWTETFVGGGIAAIAAAVLAGLAVAPLAYQVAPAGAVEVSKQLGLPPLPATDIVLHSTLSDARSREALRILATAFRERRAQPRARLS